MNQVGRNLYRIAAVFVLIGSAATQTVAAGPAFTVVSRAAHGGSEIFDIPVDTTQSIDSGNITIEPRAGESNGATHRLVFSFPGTTINPIPEVQLSGIPGSSLTTGTATAIRTGINQVTVFLNGVPDRKRLLVTLTDINGVAGANATVAVGYLFGATTGEPAVSGKQFALTNAKNPSKVDATNFLFDVILAGYINALDARTVGSRSPNSLE